MQTNSYVRLEVAARETGLDPDTLKTLCEGDSLDWHGAPFGSVYVIPRWCVERYKSAQPGLRTEGQP